MAVPHSLCCLPCPTASAFLPKAVGDAELPARHPHKLRVYGTALLSCQASPCHVFPIWVMFGAE